MKSTHKTKFALNLENLIPYAYYTINFSSEHAETGHLLLTTSTALTVQPARGTTLQTPEPLN